jgi:hypothetical protein
MSGSRYKDAQLSQIESPLFGAAMPRDVREQIVYPFTFTSIKALGMFAAACQKTEADTAFLRLMAAAVAAEPLSYKQPDETSLAAIAILTRHPELLFVKGIVTDHFGRKIFASPYQLLLGAGDKWALKQVYEEIIPMIKNGEAIAEAQFQEQFPNCKLPFDPELGEAARYDVRNKDMIAQVIVQLETIAAAITADPCTNGVATLDATTKTVAALREIFAPKEEEAIRTGLHFPLAIMQAIYKVYVAAQWDLPRLSYFSREVIGAALDASTAVDGQCYKVGLSNLNLEKGPDRRDGLFCRHPKGIPAELAPLKGKLGRTMFVDPYDGESCFQSSNKPGVFDCYDKNGRGCQSALGSRAARVRGCAWFFGKLISSKNFRLSEFMRAQRAEKTSRCVIC